MSVSYTIRPFKIAKGDMKFKGIVAANLNDIKSKAVHSLDLDVGADNVSVFLAEDDTFVDDQDYFATIPENTKLIIRPNQEKVVVDVVDAPYLHNLEVSESQEIEHDSYNLPKGLRSKMEGVNSSHCIVSLLRMSDEELEFMSNCSWEILQKEMKLDENVGRVCVDSATKELLRRKELSDATLLLDMYEKAKGTSDQMDGGKRKKTC